MSHTTSTYFNKLTENLEDQIKIYRHLLEIVRKEKDILVAAELDELNEAAGVTNEDESLSQPEEAERSTVSRLDLADLGAATIGAPWSGGGRP